MSTSELAFVTPGPNVHGFTWSIDNGPDAPPTVVTIWRSCPGDTVPHMVLNGQECGAIVDPERFGPWRTIRELRAFCARFRDGSALVDTEGRRA